MIMNTLNLTVGNGRDCFEPGERIEVKALWELAEPATAVELRLVWFTRGKGDQDVSVVESTRFEQPALSEQRIWNLDLPAAPYSFSGKLISLLWAVELLVEPGDESTRFDFTLAPGGKEVLLHGEGAS